jgi:hypothetical protein
MSSMALVMLGIASLTVILACRSKPKMQPVTVNIFRDLRSPYANELDHRLLEFQASNPHLAGGAPIVVKTLQSGQYSTEVQDHLGRDLSPDLVILNSSQDAASNPAVQAELPNSANICAAVKACPTVVPAFVPASLSGPSAAAGKQLLAFLQKQPG